MSTGKGQVLAHFPHQYGGTFRNHLWEKTNKIKGNWRRKVSPPGEQLLLCTATAVSPLIRHRRRSKKSICMRRSVPKINITPRRELIETNKTSEAKGEIRDVSIMLYLRNGFVTTSKRRRERILELGCFSGGGGGGIKTQLPQTFSADAS